MFLMLTYSGMWWAEGHRFVSWTAPSIEAIKNTKEAIEVARVPRISRSCTNVRGHGGVKRGVVFVHAPACGLYLSSPDLIFARTTNDGSLGPESDHHRCTSATETRLGCAGIPRGT